MADLYSAEHEYIWGGHEASFVFSQILWLHAFFVYFEYIQIFIFNLLSMVAHVLSVYCSPLLRLKLLSPLWTMLVRPTWKGATGGSQEVIPIFGGSFKILP